MTKPKRLLFVCLGNIVRSPLAEHLFRHVAQQRGLLNGYEVDSAGTSRAHVGEAPDPRMRRTAAKHGLHYNGSARRIQYDDLDRFDLVIAMDQTNFTDLRLMASSPDQLARIHLMREFDPHAGSDIGVPDPYYGGSEGFEFTYRIIERSIHGLLDALEQGDL